tara:strand:- start:373 stop:555 length:183 start_codon:yes stop_codon:yes gene_type:complete
MIFETGFAIICEVTAGWVTVEEAEEGDGEDEFLSNRAACMGTMYMLQSSPATRRYTSVSL